LPLGEGEAESWSAPEVAPAEAVPPSMSYRSVPSAARLGPPVRMLPVLLVNTLNLLSDTGTAELLLGSLTSSRNSRYQVFPTFTLGMSANCRLWVKVGLEFSS